MGTIKITPQSKIKAPLFCVGQVIDLSYKHGGNPNRLSIEEIRFGRSNNEWQYKVQLESNPVGTFAVANESFIAERSCNKFARVYNKPVIKKRYKEGWRFCGNHDANIAASIGAKIAEQESIKNVRVTEAYDQNGEYVGDKLAVWIRYNTIINDDGKFRPDAEYEQVTLDIK